jgi:hypothetical protein
MGATPSLCWDTLVQEIGIEALIDLLGADLFASVNWTMLPHTTDIWLQLLRHVVPYLDKKKRTLLIDLADPKKRKQEELLQALNVLSQWQGPFEVCLSLNGSESDQVARVLGLKPCQAGDDVKDWTAVKARYIQQKLCLHSVAIHELRFAAAATADQEWLVDGPYCERPLLTTGAGDNFNAGLALGLLGRLPWPQTLLLASACSGYYVRYAQSATPQQLLHFIQSWDSGALS